MWFLLFGMLHCLPAAGIASKASLKAQMAGMLCRMLRNNSTAQAAPPTGGTARPDYCWS